MTPSKSICSNTWISVFVCVTGNWLWLLKADTSKSQHTLLARLLAPASGVLFFFSQNVFIQYYLKGNADLKTEMQNVLSSSVFLKELCNTGIICSSKIW